MNASMLLADFFAPMFLASERFDFMLWTVHRSFFAISLVLSFELLSIIMISSSFTVWFFRDSMHSFIVVSLLYVGIIAVIFMVSFNLLFVLCFVLGFKYLKSVLLLVVMYVCRICDDFHSPKSMKVDLSTHITPLTMALSKMGVQQTIIARNSEIDCLDDIDIYNIKPERPFSLIRSGLTVCKKIDEIKKDFDLIHFHNPAFSSVLLKRKLLPPIIMTLHDSPGDIRNNISFDTYRGVKEGFYYYYMSKYAAKRANAVVCVSSGVSDFLMRVWGVDAERVFTITTAVDVKVFYPRRIEKDIDLLFVGRFVDKKRPFDFLKVVSILKKVYPNLKACMVGGSPSDALYDGVAQWIELNGLSRSVSVISPVAQHELSSLYSRSKVLLLPSVTESSPKVSLEAMACGVPVVITDIMGNKDVLVDGRTGFFVPQKNPDVMASKIRMLLDDESLRKKMGDCAVKRIIKDYTWEIVSEKYVRLYDSLI